jgi:hypothetical protein
VVEAVWDPDVPVMDTVYCPTGVEPLAVSVRLLLEVAGLGEKEALTPLGKPETERFTLLLNPYSENTFTQEEYDEPRPMLTPPGPESVNDGT